MSRSVTKRQHPRVEDKGRRDQLDRMEEEARLRESRRRDTDKRRQEEKEQMIKTNTIESK
jgi:hypothetical protein